jgi:hypothetical protein
MAMSFTKERTMIRTPARIVTLLALAASGALLSACTESVLRDAPDFGEATRQNVAAKIADPNAHYTGVPDPASNGTRTFSAQERYAHHAVLEPAVASSTTTGGGGGGSGGGSGGGGGGGAGGMGQAVGAP